MYQVFVRRLLVFTPARGTSHRRSLRLFTGAKGICSRIWSIATPLNAVRDSRIERAEAEDCTEPNEVETLRGKDADEWFLYLRDGRALRPDHRVPKYVPCVLSWNTLVRALPQVRT
jgi:hypothetical protein